MATIGPSITIAATGPGGTREVGFSNFFVSGQSPWGIDGTWQICTSFQDFQRKYGALNKIPQTTKTGTVSITQGTTAIAGSGTNFLNDCPIGSRFTVDGGSAWYVMTATASGTAGTFTPSFVATTVAAVPYISQAIASGTTTDTPVYESSAGVTQPFYSAQAYFAEKQSNSPGVLYFCRTVASATPVPTAAVLTANDGAAHNTTFTAKWKGLWGNATMVTLTNPSPTSGTGFVQVKADHTIANIHEVWDIANANDAANVSKKSELITVTLPAGGQLPSTLAQQKLGTGTSTAGGVVDQYLATSTDLVGTTTGAGVKTGLQVFNDQKLGSGFVAIPGKFDSTARSGINTHCSTYFRLGLLGTTSGLNLTTVVSDLSTTNGPDLDYIWPNLYVTDITSFSGGQVLVDPVGHRAGLYARMDKEYRGPHKSAAGITHPIISALDVERASGTFMELCDDAGSALLADSLINTARIKGNPGGVVFWGNRTLSQDNRYRQCSVRRILHLIYLTTFLSLETATFEPIDPFGALFSKVKGDIDTFLFSLWRNGTLYGQNPGKDPAATDAWFVTCDSSNNPGQAIQAGELHVDVSFVPTFNAERITESLYLTTPGFINRAQ